MMSITQLLGTLGKLAQVLVNAVNYLRVQQQGRGDAETDAGNAFFGFRTRGAVAAEYAHVQLKNPAASGKTFYVDRIEGRADTGAREFYVTMHNADLANAGGALVNRDAGGAAASTATREETNAAIQGTTIASVSTAASGQAVFTFDPPIKLGAAEGVNIVVNATNVPLGATFYGREY